MRPSSTTRCPTTMRSSTACWPRWRRSTRPIRAARWPSCSAWRGRAGRSSCRRGRASARSAGCSRRPPAREPAVEPRLDWGDEAVLRLALLDDADPDSIVIKRHELAEPWSSPEAAAEAAERALPPWRRRWRPIRAPTPTACAPRGAARRRGERGRRSRGRGCRPPPTAAAGRGSARYPAATRMPKMKTHSGAKKRFKLTAKGKVRGASRLHEPHPREEDAKRKRALRQAVGRSPTTTPRASRSCSGVGQVTRVKRSVHAKQEAPRDARADQGLPRRGALELQARQGGAG